MKCACVRACMCKCLLSIDKMNIYILLCGYFKIASEVQDAYSKHDMTEQQQPLEPSTVASTSGGIPQPVLLSCDYLETTSSEKEEEEEQEQNEESNERAMDIL